MPARPLHELDPAGPIVVGVLSDTHGLLRPEVELALQGVDRILHGGDVGSAEVLQRLTQIAPVIAVRGNNDRGAWAAALPDSAVVHIGGVAIYLVHDAADLTVDPRAARCTVVVTGHSHRPLLREEQDVLWLNPGSAGPRRFRLPVSVARLVIAGGRATAELQPLEVEGAEAGASV